MRKYKYLVWCQDCLDVSDDMGCFGGRKELSEKSYDTKEEAKVAAEKLIYDSIWEYEIVEDWKDKNEK